MTSLKNRSADKSFKINTCLVLLKVNKSQLLNLMKIVTTKYQ